MDPCIVDDDSGRTFEGRQQRTRFSVRTSVARFGKGGKCMRANQKTARILIKSLSAPVRQTHIKFQGISSTYPMCGNRYVCAGNHPEVSLLAALTQAEAEYDSLTRWCIRAPYRSCAC